MKKINLTFLIAGFAVVSAATLISPAKAAAFNINEIKQRAREMTVLVEGQAAPGSGVIIRQEGSTYYVLTAYHVMATTSEEAEVTTCDGSVYWINKEKIKRWSENIDLVLVQFSTEKPPIDTKKGKDFQPDCQPVAATLSNYNYPLYKDRNQSLSDSSIAKEPYIFIAGWPLQEQKEFVFNPGILYDNVGTSISQPEIRKEGYELVYTNLSHPGMSGGPILDSNGRLIGIHGRADGKEVSAEDLNEIVGQGWNESEPVRVKIGFSLGIPIQTFLQLAPQEDYSLESSAPKPISAVDLDSWRPPVSLEDKNNPLYWLDKGNQLWRLGREMEALEDFDQAIELNQKFYLAWFAKGFVLGFNGRYPEADEACNQATKIDRNFYEAWRCRAEALLELKRFDTALVALNRAIEIAPDNPADFTTQGELRFFLGQYRGAIESFNQGIEIRKNLGLPKSALLYNNRGLARLNLKQYELAQTDFERAIAINPNYAPAWENQGYLFLLSGQYPESLAALNRSLELDPDNVNGWHNRGATLYALKRYEEALDSFDQALNLDPNYEPAIEYRNAVLEQLGN
ncbi:MAG: tetratricopeptide repeat protein [Prochloron sp. SP5CPC1]|nr:tetratricopeptide repeat protein [Candidatus Paraprochloron terpiosi SP5CPC1]